MTVGVGAGVEEAGPGMGSADVAEEDGAGLDVDDDAEPEDDADSFSPWDPPGEHALTPRSNAATATPVSDVRKRRVVS